MQQIKNQKTRRPTPIKRVLIANRGEIAVRVMRTCRELGIETIAVFSEADRSALHVRMADRAFCVGPPSSSQSYLVQDRIIEVARAQEADAIHPGYGFLSENASFAEKCRQAGILFIGPPPGAIKAMGDKTHARALMEEAGVPMAPGTTEPVDDVDRAAEIAEQIGFPILIKAAAGGGGKGMRLVSDLADFSTAMEMAQREAASAFGDGRVFLEKYITQPRHIEFQILMDEHGNGVHLFERECSIQRRHQKVIEEAPSCVLTPEVRDRMGEAALMAAQACGYTNAGTVEFLIDADLNFYFMEMNTRLQVEHPVTEMITGIDLVEEQLRVAAGEALGYTQADVSINGHAIECRVYAEDPSNNFLPGPGTLLLHRPPSGPGIRVDEGVGSQGEIPIHYDPMISKLIVHAGNREEALDKMGRALEEYQVAGVPTTIPFCRYVVDHDAFRSGNFSTHFVGDYFTPDVLESSTEEEDRVALIAAAWLAQAQVKSSSPSNGSVPSVSAWKRRAL